MTNIAREIRKMGAGRLVCVKYRLYMAWSDREYTFGLTPDPGLDRPYLAKKGYTHLAVLTEPLPLGPADHLLHTLRQEGKPGIWPKILALFGQREERFVPERILAVKQRLLGRKLAELGLPGKGTREEARLTPAVDTPDDGVALQQVRHVLRGRILLAEEVQRALRENNCRISEELTLLLHRLVLRGEVICRPAVGLTRPGVPVCNRCGEAVRLRRIACATCACPCWVCEECLGMGESKTCQPLYASPGVAAGGLREKKESKTKLKFPLTPAQSAAAAAVRDFVAADRRAACLVWAVCGAGKTEVAYEAIEETLQRGGKVMFAIPRKDVVMELEPRLRQAFPAAALGALHGKAVQKYQPWQLVIATTHQAIRFYHAFDLVVLDEVDAFPYDGSRMLYHAVARARKPGGKIVYMTATPGKDLYRQACAGEMALVRIPARHHGYPLPEPAHVVVKLARPENGKPWPVPPELVACLGESMAENTQVFVFLPGIALVETVGLALQRLFGEEKVLFSHSRDPARDTKRDAFSAGEFPVFVTTTIMERGITVPRANVVVLFADTARIFASGTLIQMAGRAGRSADYPQGKVWFMAGRINEEMEFARRCIVEMNEEARRKGYLKTQPHLLK